MPPIVTIATTGYANYVANFHAHCRRHGLELLVYAADDEVADVLRTCYCHSIPLENLGPAVRHQAIYGTTLFRDIMFRKLEAIEAALQTHEIVVWMDADVAFRKDPTLALERIATVMRTHDVDLAMQCDDPTLECRGPDRCWMCAGIMILRRTPKTLDMLAGIPPAAEFPSHWESDQDYVNWYVRNKNPSAIVLPRRLFPNGVFVHADAIPSTAVAVHYNYMKGSEKFDAMTRLGDWIL